MVAVIVVRNSLRTVSSPRSLVAGRRNMVRVRKCDSTTGTFGAASGKTRQRHSGYKSSELCSSARDAPTLRRSASQRNRSI